jgi:hypothetical protein
MHYTVHYSKSTTTVEVFDEHLADRSFTRRIVLVHRQAEARRPATAVARLRVDATEERGGSTVIVRALAHLAGRVRLFTLLGFRDAAYANAMAHQAQDICQQVLGAIREGFGAPKP